jgi:hypothetical protein
MPPRHRIDRSVYLEVKCVPDGVIRDPLGPEVTYPSPSSPPGHWRKIFGVFVHRRAFWARPPTPGNVYCVTMPSFDDNPRDYALELVEREVITSDQMALAALKWLSHDDVRAMLDANEWSPRFIAEPE